MQVSSPTLVYPPIQNGITNIVLIDNSVRDYQVFIDSANAQTLPIVYSPSCSKQELLNVLTANFQSLSRVAFVFETNGSYTFLDNAPMFVLNESSVPSGENTDFLIALIKQFQIQNIDFLACGSLNMPEWKAFYDVLGKETNIVVGASSDNTGNIQYGGDWIMESSGQDVELVYFTQSIEYYQYLLGYAASSSYFIGSNGFIYSCGLNTAGILGIGSTTQTATPTQMTATNLTGLTPVYISSPGSNNGISSIFKNVSTSSFILFGCGSATNGQLAGVNGPTILTKMTDVSATPLSIGSGTIHTVVLLSNGTVYSCGFNNRGQLGTGDALNVQRSVLTLVPNPVVNTVTLSAIQVVVTSGTTYILYNNSSTGLNTVYACGDLTNYAAGQNLTNNNINLVAVPNSTTFNPLKISAGETFLMMVMDNGTLYGVGYNNTGQIGNGNTTTQQSLAQTTLPNGLTALNVFCGPNYTFALLSNNTLYACGLNTTGQLATGNFTSPTTLTQSISTGQVPVAVSCNWTHTYMLAANGNVYSCGGNTNGQLGIGSLTDTSRNYWTQVTLASTITSIADNTYVNTFAVPCFHEDTRILTNKGYKMVKELRRGDSIQTLCHGFLPIDCIGYSTIHNSGDTERISKRLYRCSPDVYDELFEDLIVTGCHSILVDDFKEGEREKTFELLEDIFITDDKLRLPACIDERAIPYEKEGTFTIWHFALENENYYENYGVYANGLLVETTSKRYMRELSNMILIE